MTSFRAQLAVRMALNALGLFIAIGLACVLALRALLHNQLDGTLLHLAEVEAQAGAATTGSDFEFHEGVLLAAREGSTAELTRFAQLWTREGKPLVRSMNLPGNLELLLLAPADRDLRAELAERDRRGEPDAATASGDDGDVSVEQAFAEDVGHGEERLLLRLLRDEARALFALHREHSHEVGRAGSRETLVRTASRASSSARSFSGTPLCPGT